MRLVVIESPFAGDLARNQRYLRAAMRDCIQRGEWPYASHGLLTQPGVLDDAVPEERQRGIDAGFAWRASAHATVVYVDLGMSRGMIAGLAHAARIGHPVEERRLGGEWAAPVVALPVCATCNDTHRMAIGERHGFVPCTRCPTPCDLCSGGMGGPYCALTPCACDCHAKRGAP